MKLKLTVLTLLVAGLVLGLTGIAYGDAVLSLKAQNNDTYNIDSGGHDINGVPLLVFSVSNTGGTAINLTSFKVTNGAANTAGDHFTVTTINDVNGNGIYDKGDTVLLAATILSAADDAETVLNISDVAIAATTGKLNVIVLANMPTATATDGEGVELIVNTDDLTITEAPTVAQTATAGKETNLVANVPQLLVADGAGSVTAGDATVAMAIGNLPNKKTGYVVHKFNLLNDDDDVTHVLSAVRLTTVFGGAAAGTDFANVRMYLDIDNSGTATAGDIELTITPTTIIAGAGANDYTLTTPVFFDYDVDYDVIVTVDGQGTASDGEAITANLTVGGTLIDGVAVGGVANGAVQTIKALVATATTKDFVGHSYNSSRPNGYLDAVKLSFTAAGAAKAINDATLILSNFTLYDGGAAAYSGLSFTATYQGDAVNDDKVYIKHTEKINVANSSTVSTGTLDYNASTKVLSLDGDYALVMISGGGVADGAGPAPISITTSDVTGNGLIDRLNLQFSEGLAGTKVADAPGVSTILVAGHTVANAADALVASIGTTNWGADSNLQVDIDELSTKDSSEKPAVSFAGTAGEITDAGGNNVAAWASVHLNVIDGAGPTLVKVETQDINPVDGHLDALKLTFSESVQKITGVTDAELVADFAFTGGFEANYSFVAGATISGKTLTLPVVPRAEYDSGVKPLIKYTANKGNVGTTGTVEDLTGADVVAIPIILPVATVTSADEVVLKDSIKPVLTSATTLDGYVGTMNGKIEAYKLIFSEQMEATIANYNTVKVAGNLVTTGASVINADTVWVKFTEGENYDTNAKPEVTYTCGVALYDSLITDVNGNILNPLVAGSIAESDGAVPLIVGAKIKDIGYGKWVSASKPKAANGKVDAIVLTFSEPVDTAKVQYDETAGTSLIKEITFTATYSVGDTLAMFAADFKSVTVPIIEIGTPDTDLADFNSELVYTSAGKSKLKDMAGNAVPNVIGDDTPPNVAETDGAPPVAISATTVDDNNDGFIDGVDITFSEPPVVGADDTVKVKASVTLAKISNDIVLTAAKVSATGDILSLVGTSSMGVEKWDTDKLPKAFIASGNGVKDAAGNEVIATADSVVTTDNAAPIIAKALGQKEAKTILVTFSEPVTDEGAVDLDVGDILYINYADSTDMTAITAIDTGADAAHWILTTDNTLTQNHVTKDKIAIVAGKVIDIASVAAFVDSILISDTGIPTLVSAKTMDINTDGMIDTIKLTFSEAIKDANLSGYAAVNDTLVIVPATGPSKWTVSGYTVIGVNKTISSNAAATATANLAKDIYNVGDTPNDAVLYLALVEKEEADTDVTPTLSMVGGAVGGPMASGVSDYAPNYVATITGFQITDNAGPAIMSAKMTSTRTMDIVMSEAINDDDDYGKASTYPLASAVFVWKVGSQKKDWITNVVNFGEYADNRGTMYLEVVEGMGLNPGLASTIALVAGQLEDDSTEGKTAGVLNTDTTAIDVTPAVTPVAVESDLPDAFALSKNFPNPFNPTTTIEYAIPADGAGHVELIIYNINGQKVRSLVNETKDAGYYNVVWDGRNDSGEMVSSGLYLYKIVSGSFNKVERMTFMK